MIGEVREEVEGERVRRAFHASAAGGEGGRELDVLFEERWREVENGMSLTSDKGS